MTQACRSWWRNCAIEADSEVLEIDQLEDEIAPLASDVARIRELISSLELCHHKAARWVHNIIEAIGLGETSKGLGTRPPGQLHPAEEVWQAACAGLSAWCAGCPAASLQLSVGGIPTSRLLAGLGQRSPLKEWQVYRVIDKIRSLLPWLPSSKNPAAQYVWILLGGGEYELLYRSRCPEHYREHEDFWAATARTLICDAANGESATLSLGLAIDMLWPCHWRFVENLQIVLDAIGGRLKPEKPFAACGRNIGLSPIRDRMRVVSATLRAFCGRTGAGGEADPQILVLLGQPTAARKWLAASLDKTLRLQMDPPAGVRAISALTGPDWVRQV
ncbi:MAG: hypothetical protein ACE15B_24560 [Bryobacteraceae bacterium]